MKRQLIIISSVMALAPVLVFAQGPFGIAVEQFGNSQYRPQQAPQGGHAAPVRVQQAPVNSAPAGRPQQLQPVAAGPRMYIQRPDGTFLEVTSGALPAWKPEFAGKWEWIQVTPHNGAPTFMAIEKPVNAAPAVTGNRPSGNSMPAAAKIADCVFNAKTGKLDCTYSDGTTTQVTPTTDASKKIIAANPTARFQFSEAGFKEANGLKLRVAPPDAGKIVPPPKDVPSAPQKKNPLSSVLAPIPDELIKSTNTKPRAPIITPPVPPAPKLKPVEQMTPAEIEAEIRARGGNPATR